SSCATPSPFAYIRPSFHCATKCPSSAAYCKAVSESAGVAADAPPCGTAFLIAAAAPGCPDITAIAESWLAGAPSKADAGPAKGAVSKNHPKIIRSNVRIALLLVRTARVCHGSCNRWSYLLSIFPERARCVLGLPGLPFGFALGQLGIG